MTSMRSVSDLGQSSRTQTSRSRGVTDTLEKRVFKVPKGLKDAKQLKGALARNKVYDITLFEQIFPTCTLKSNIHEEICIEEGCVDTNINLVSESVADGLDEEKEPYLHLGCVAVAIIPHGRNMSGRVDIKLEDQRFQEGKGTLCHFQAELRNALSAFAQFPGYFVSTIDVKNGYALNLKIKASGMHMHDGTHPLSLQVYCIMKKCDESFEHRYALSALKPGAYQSILNTTQIEDVPIQYSRPPARTVEPDNEKTLIMPSVYEAINKLYPNHGKEYLKDGTNESSDRGVGNLGGNLRN
uniref:Movement protein n=1 Tax=Vitivirus alphactinidiae TaxID=1112769 RepID=A0A510I1B4_9VIRU|nr:movement protein [Actinidia virus A]